MTTRYCGRVRAVQFKSEATRNVRVEVQCEARQTGASDVRQNATPAFKSFKRRSPRLVTSQCEYAKGLVGVSVSNLLVGHTARWQLHFEGSAQGRGRC